MEYVNVPAASAWSRSSKDADVTPAAQGRKLFTLVAVSFGLLCILQVALNISLRLALYSPDSETLFTETICKNATEETDELRKLSDRLFQQGWVYLRPSFYYISSIKKTWQESRDECLQRGADLLIINTRREQDFARKFSKEMWIGLTDREEEGEWKWVDGTPLNTSFSYWHHGEPNGHGELNEDCVEVNFREVEMNWNDITCEDQNFWICEKIVAPSCTG